MIVAIAVMVATVLSVPDATAAEQITCPRNQMPSGGERWGGNRSVKALAFGDIDADGNDEVAIGRSSGVNMEFQILDDAKNCFKVLHSENWGRKRSVTAIAFGDIDGDGYDEVAIGRSRGSGTRYTILDDAKREFQPLIAQGGEGWNKRYGVSALAFGDIDDDGYEELAIGRYGTNKGANMRYTIIDDARRRFTPLVSGGGKHWNKRYGVSALAFGDIDNDNVPELAVGRYNVNGNDMSYQVLDYTTSTNRLEALVTKRRDANDGKNLSVTALAFGDTDAKGGDELAVGWAKNRPFEIIAGTAEGYKRIYRDPNNARVTDLAFGDVDKDPSAELLVGSRTRGLHYRIIGDRHNGFSTLKTWSGSGKRYVTSVALGDTDGDALDELAIGRRGPGRRFAKKWRYGFFDDYHNGVESIPKTRRTATPTTPNPTTTPESTAPKPPSPPPTPVEPQLITGVCSALAAPVGFFRVAETYAPVGCPESNPFRSTYLRYDDKPVGHLMRICYPQTLPSNWAQVSISETDGSCRRQVPGFPSGDQKVQTVKRIT